MIKKIVGITLLEVVLVLAVVASILLLTVRYFMMTSSHENVNRAMTQIQTLTKASYEWLQIQRQADFASGNAIDITQLQQAGLISAVDRVDPWGGNIVISPADDANYVRINMADVPQKACKNLRQRMNAIAHAQSACAGEDNIYFVDL